MAVHKIILDDSPQTDAGGLWPADIAAADGGVPHMLRLAGVGHGPIPVPPDERLIQFMSRLAGPVALGLGVLSLLRLVWA